MDEGYRVVFDLPKSIFEHAATGRKIPTYRKNGAFVLQLDVRPNTKPSRTEMVGGPADESERGDDSRSDPSLRWLA